MAEPYDYEKDTRPPCEFPVDGEISIDDFNPEGKYKDCKIDWSKAITDKYIVVFEKTFKRNFIHIQDVANTFSFMLKNYDTYRGEVFNVGLSDANLNKQELLEKIQTHVKDFAVVYDDYYEDPDKRNYIVSNEKLEQTGWKPEWDLDMGIKELIMAYQMIVPKMSSEFRNGFPLGYANQT